MSRKPQLINIHVKIYYISMSISFKFNYITYKINKIIFYLFTNKNYYK